jgi:hypothetical protein
MVAPVKPPATPWPLIILTMAVATSQADARGHAL